MTILVAAKIGTELWWGCDTQTTDTTGQKSFPGTKWRNLDNNWWIANAGSAVFDSLFAIHQQTIVDLLDLNYGLAHFSVWLAEAIAKNPALTFHFEKHQSDCGGKFLLVNTKQKRIFSLDEDTSFEEVRTFKATGAGEDYAFGAWSILRETDMNPEAKIRKTLEVAVEYSSVCGGELKVYYAV